jgi:NAD(P)-dependent dehydrogenase (short-subunit alcohol dehydrogenase family)
MRGWTANDMPDQAGRVVLITGANSGLGYHSAVAFARKGARVVMACRSMDKAERARAELLKAAPGGTVDILPLDLAGLPAVRESAASFGAQYDRLDILMNNAGLMIPPYGRTADGFESQFGTNHLGHFALAGLLLPKLLATPDSRVVTVSSGAYLSGRIHFDDLQSERRYNPWLAYAQSKLANILFMEELQRRLDAAHADVISVASHPGYAVTNLQRHMNGFFDVTVVEVIRPLISQNAEQGATYQLYAATAPGVRGGEFFGPRFGVRGEVVRWGVTPQGRNTALAARLWQVSEQLTGVRFDALEQPGRKSA